MAIRRRFNKNRRQPRIRIRINGYIRVPEVQVVDVLGRPLGVMRTDEALRQAQEAELDLVEIDPLAKPPLTKIVDYGKYMYDKGKKARSSRQGKQASQEIKTVRITFRAGDHDLDIRAKQADTFMIKGHRVKIELKLRGRERAMKDVAREKMQHFLSLLQTEHIIEGNPKNMGGFMTLLVTPVKK
jgi:translation initiation factor IF-3